MYTHIDDELAAQLSRRLPRPFGPGDDAEGNLGTGGGQDQSANPVGDGATPLTLQDIDRLLNERLAPVQRAMDDTRNHREQVNRRLGLGKYKGQQEVDAAFSELEQAAIRVEVQTQGELALTSVLLTTDAAAGR